MSIRDGDWTLIDWDAQTGRTVWQAFDSAGRRVVRTDYPVDDVIEANRSAMAETSNRHFGDWARVASIPLNIAYQSGFIEATTQQDDRFVAKFLNDSDNRAWRTHEGTV